MEDVAEAFACVLHKGIVGEVYNIGTQKERTVLDVAQDIAKVFKLPSEKIVHVRDRAFNDRYANAALHETVIVYHQLDTVVGWLGDDTILLYLCLTCVSMS